MTENRSNRYCNTGCPYGAPGVVCLLDKSACPIDAMYQKLKNIEANGPHCEYCSNYRRDRDGKWIALGGCGAGNCGQCPHYCPACSAPKKRK